MASRRLWPVVLLAPLGAVFGHQLAYAVPHADHPVGSAAVHSHGHLGPLAAVALLLALAGAGWLLRRPIGSGPLPAVPVVAGAQIGAFAALEVAERLLAGGAVGELARSPVLWVGLGAQAAVASAVVAGLRATRRAVGALLLRVPASAPVLPAPAAVPLPATAPAPRPPEATRWLLGRGPPVLLGP